MGTNIVAMGTKLTDGVGMETNIVAMGTKLMECG